MVSALSVAVLLRGGDPLHTCPTASAAAAQAMCAADPVIADNESTQLRGPGERRGKTSNNIAPEPRRNLHEPVHCVSLRTCILCPVLRHLPLRHRFRLGLVVPKTIDTGTVVPMAEALIVNLLLMSLFAIQHSVMARQQFKQWWTQFVPKSVERSTYVLLASLALILLFWQWRPMPAVVWHIAESADRHGGDGAVVRRLADRADQHVPDQPLRAVRAASGRQQSRRPPDAGAALPHAALYKFVRHPIYLGFIIAFWAAPTMTVGHLLFAAVTTAYILVGILLEERDLIDLFGDEYRRYKDRVSMLVPWRKSA